MVVISLKNPRSLGHSQLQSLCCCSWPFSLCCPIHLNLASCELLCLLGLFQSLGPHDTMMSGAGAIVRPVDSRVSWMVMVSGAEAGWYPGESQKQPLGFHIAGQLGPRNKGHTRDTYCLCSRPWKSLSATSALLCRDHNTRVSFKGEVSHCYTGEISRFQV